MDKKKYNFECYGYQIGCNPFLAIDEGVDGVDIYVDGIWVSEYLGAYIPDAEDEESCIQFEEDIKDFLRECNHI